MPRTSALRCHDYTADNPLSVDMHLQEVLESHEQLERELAALQSRLDAAGKDALPNNTKRYSFKADKVHPYANLFISDEGDYVLSVDYDALRSHAVALQLERDGMKRDAERLDAIEKNQYLLSWSLGTGSVEVIEWGMRSGVIGRGDNPLGSRRHEAATLREAIDKAQLADSGGEGM